MLEGVLEDFGVKGEIIHVRPGPVVTLYELEPAPGSKSSRVNRSRRRHRPFLERDRRTRRRRTRRNATASSCRTSGARWSYLRELIGSRDFETTKTKLAHGARQDIGGDPSLPISPRCRICSSPAPPARANRLANQHHDPVAAPNRLRPDQCRLIMNRSKCSSSPSMTASRTFLSPVVTDPKKAVVALNGPCARWKSATRRFEDRRAQIDGFNSRVEQALAKGERSRAPSRPGFDRQTGAGLRDGGIRIFRRCPIIVVIIDRDGRPDDGRRQGYRRRRPVGLRRWRVLPHPVHHGDTSALGRRHHRHDQGELPDPHLLPGDLQDRQPHHPRRTGSRTAPGHGDMLYMAGGGRIQRVHGPLSRTPSRRGRCHI